MIRLVLVTIIFFIFFLRNSSSQEMEPRNYSGIPIGMNALALVYAYQTGDIVTDAAAPIKDLELNSNNLGIGYLRSFGLLGKLCKVQVAVPFVFLSGSAKLQGRDTSATRTGFADSKLKFIMNIIGTPALAPKDFVKFKEEFVLGASVAVSVPTGLYYNDKLINLGSNRWGFKPEIGMSYNKGPVFFELFTGVWLFTENTDYFKGNTLYQNPVYSLQGHISYYFPSKIYLALDGVYVDGGETKLNDTYRRDFQKNFRSGVTLSVPINANNSIKANFSAGVATRVGGDFKIFSITFQHIWF